MFFFDADTAVLKMTAAVSFSPTVRPVCLPAHPADTFEAGVCVATGWGSLDDGSSPDKLMKVEVEVISNDQCRNSYSSVAE